MKEVTLSSVRTTADLRAVHTFAQRESGFFRVPVLRLLLRTPDIVPFNFNYSVSELLKVCKNLDKLRAVDFFLALAVNNFNKNSKQSEEICESIVCFKRFFFFVG